MNIASITEELKFLIDNKTKPPGSLGRLEEIACRIGTIQNTLTPSVSQPHIIVFAGDHGIAATGIVNPYPQQVTAQMVMNFINGGAAINVFCKQNGIRLKVVDAGVRHDFTSLYSEDFINSKMADGTEDYRFGKAMSERQATSSIEKGKNIVLRISHETGCNCIGFGEMGIGNSSSASLIMSAVTGIPIQECIGRGTGSNDEQLRTKANVLKSVFSYHKLQYLSSSPTELLSTIGGYEIAQMVGAYLQAFEQNMVIVVDGFIATAGLLIAQQINPQVSNNCIFAHCSEEKGHSQMLAYLNVKPLLNLGLRLGEGTGAALAIPLIQSSVNFINQMASFRSAAVSTRTQ